MKIALVQYNPAWENKEESQKKIMVLMKRLESDVSLIIFPELTLTGFTMRSKRFAEELSGNSVKFFSRLAKEYSSHVMAGFIEAEEHQFFNTLVHINDAGEIVAKYHKIHPFTYTREDKHYGSGAKPVITKIESIKIGLSICYDLRFPELYRYYAKNRVDLIIDIANWPEDRIEHWYSLLKARAIENQSYIVGVNRVGKDKANQYVGWSAAFHPDGVELLCIRNETTIANVQIIKEDVTETRKKFPFLNDIKLI